MCEAGSLDMQPHREFEVRAGILAGSLALVLLSAQAQPQAGQQTVAQQTIPDAPRPQATLPNLNNITPGEGTTSSSATGATPSATAPDGSPISTGTAAAPGAAAAGTAPQAQPASAGTSETPAQGSSTMPPSGEGVQAVAKTLHVNVNAVEVPFTVKDSKGRLVPGLMPRDVQVYENGVMQRIRTFTGDAFPLSVVLVIDQSMSKDDMERVNESLGSLQDAFTKYDEVAVFTYNKSPKQITDFTGAQSTRLTASIERAKGEGEDELLPGSLSGPLSQTLVVNNQQFDPNTAPVRGHNGIQLNPPRDVHALNDAILAAASALSTRPVDRRRVIYVISDGKEFGSEAKTGQVIKYLLTNNIEVDGTLVGESALWGIGTIDRIHLPLFMRDNVLPVYANDTGGNIDAEFRTRAIETSYARIAAEARYRYTLVYYSPEPFVDDKYRKIEVKVLRPDLTVLAKPGYWPGAMELRPRGAGAIQ